jgi:hypothetical protein
MKRQMYAVYDQRGDFLVRLFGFLYAKAERQYAKAYDDRSLEETGKKVGEIWSTGVFWFDLV